MTTEQKDTATTQTLDPAPVQTNPPSDKVNVNPPLPVEATADSLLQTEAGKALAEKIRTEEKDKLYKGIKKSDAATKALKDEKAQLIAAQAKLQKQIDDTEAEKESRSKDLEAQLADVREKQRKAEAESKAILEEAARMVKESEMNALKKEKLAEAGVDKDLVDLSRADTPEAIDQALAAAKVKEQSIEERIRARVREEMGHEVPKPLAPNQDQPSPIEMAAMDPARRLELARKSPEEFAKIQEAALKKAVEGLSG